MSFLKHNPTHLLSTHLDMWPNSSFPSVYPETVSYFKGQNGKSYILFLSRFYKLFFFFYLCPQDIIKCKNKQSEFLSCRESQQGGWRVWGVGMSVCTGWGEASTGRLMHRPSGNLENRHHFLNRKEMQFEYRK